MRIFKLKNQKLFIHQLIPCVPQCILALMSIMMMLVRDTLAIWCPTATDSAR